MNNGLHIFTNIIAPIFMQIAAGYILQKLFDLNIGTLTKLQFYILIPALLITKIYRSELTGGMFLTVVLCCLLLFICLYAISRLVSRLSGFSKQSTNAFINSVCFYNSGNYMLPLMQLVYNNPFALSVQIIVMMTQNVITNTIGIFNSSSGNKSARHAILDTLKVPMVYSIAFALIMRGSGAKIWEPAWNALEILGQGMIPVALISLGAQLANTRITLRIPRVYLSNFIRLFMGPALAWLLVILFGLHGMIAQIMVISSASPSAVNTVLLAVEYGNEPDFAAQAVFLSTIFSAVTVSAVIYLATNFIK